MRNDGKVVVSPQSRHVCFEVSANLLCSGNDIYTTEIKIHVFNEHIDSY